MFDDTTIKLHPLLAAGFGAGLYYFLKGLRVFREYHVLIDTPTTPIRGVAMGLVGIHGKATIQQPVLSPVTRTPCCFYKVDIQTYVRDKSGGNWIHIATDADGPRFYLEDASGKVLVDAHHAEYDLPPTASVVVTRDSAPKLAQVSTRSRRRALRRIAGSSAPGAEASSPWDLWSYAVDASVRNNGSPMSRLRLTESLVVPDHWYDLTGTCVENPAPQDERDRSMIMKGSNEPTFLITWRSEKEIRRTLRNRAAKHIFGGGLLAVACLGIFLLMNGWLI